MPCILPVLGIKVVHIVESAQGKRPWLGALSFSLGILSSLWLMAFGVILLRAGGEQVGWGFQLQDPLFVLALSGIFLVFALNLLGLFEWSLPSNAAMQATRWSNIKGATGSFLSGVFLTFLATPCSAPFMGSAVGISFTLGAFETFLVFTALGIGLALPYLLLALIPALQKFIPKPGAWMETLKKTAGFLLLGTLIYMIWILEAQASNWVALSLVWFWLLSFALWGMGRWGGLYSSTLSRWIWKGIAFVLFVGGLLYFNAQKETLLEPVSHTEVSYGWTPYSLEAFNQAHLEGKSVFINFTARWCWTCQINKKQVLSKSKTIELFNEHNVVLLEADWTKKDPLITAALESYNRISVPTYVFAAPNVAPIILSEVLTFSELESILK